MKKLLCITSIFVCTLFCSLQLNGVSFKEQSEQLPLDSAVTAPSDSDVVLFSNGPEETIVKTNKNQPIENFFKSDQNVLESNQPPIPLKTPKTLEILEEVTNPQQKEQINILKSRIITAKIEEQATVKNFAQALNKIGSK